MTERQQRKLGIWLIAAGGVLLAIGATESQIGQLTDKLPKGWGSVVVIFGIFTIIAGLILWSISHAPPIMTWRDYECRKARKRDLPIIHKFAVQEFGDDVSPLEVMRRWHGRNASVFFVLITEKKKAFEETKRVVGYFCAIPLLESAMSKIESGEIKGRDIPNEYVASTRKECSAIYIGGLAGRGIGAKAALLAVMNREFMSADSQWATTIYTRPITKDGRRIAMQKGFMAIDDSHHGDLGVVYKLQLDRPATAG
jgi:hypothetical protein